jgi:predicted MFS family arabinose efflux permease
VFRPYREVLSLPGALAFSSAGLLARLPISMYGIGIVLLVSGTGGSYALAGGVAAAFGLTQVVASPRVARWFDRAGQRRVLPPLTAVHAAGLLALVTLASVGAPAWTLFAAAVLAGAPGTQVWSLVRTRWTALLAGGGARLSTAFSFESVVDELIFIVGPVAVTLLCTRVAPEAGLLAAALAVTVGSLALAAQRSTEPPTIAVHHTEAGSVLRVRAMRVLIPTFVAAGGVFGSVEVITVAFAAEHGRPAAAGPVLAIFAFGSMVAGLGYGAVRWRAPAGRRFVVAALLLSVGVVPFAFATTLPVLAVALGVAGLAISPMIVAGFALVQETVPAARLTEGLTWTTSGIQLGASAGAALSGPAIDRYGAHPAFGVSVAFAAAAVAVVAAGAAVVRTRPRN